MFKKLLIKLLFKLLDKDIEVINEKNPAQWLSQNYKNMQFYDYIKHRDLHLLKNLGTGISGKDYWITIGRRFEVLSLLASVKRSYILSEKNKKRSGNKIKKS